MTDATRGTLRIYLGAAPGVGKTFAMLDEGRRRLARGTDVVVGFVETHGRRHTAEQLDGLPVLARASGRMDLAAVLERHPQVALVDDMQDRWRDVEVLLDAGIDVVSTLNIQHLESMSDVVQQITGVREHETVPDAIVRAAEQVELVDMSPA